MTRQTTSITLSTEQQTTDLARTLSKLALPGDCFLLSGQIGAGKSAFCRAFIRARLGTDTEVPSPTYTVVQTYEDTDKSVEIWHADLYRLSDPFELIELGLVDAFDDAICLVEWPELLAEMAPDRAIHITISLKDDKRQAEINASADWAERMGPLFNAA